MLKKTHAPHPPKVAPYVHPCATRFVFASGHPPVPFHRPSGVAAAGVLPEAGGRNFPRNLPEAGCGGSASGLALVLPHQGSITARGEAEVDASSRLRARLVLPLEVFSAMLSVPRSHFEREVDEKC